MRFCAVVAPGRLAHLCTAHRRRRGFEAAREEILDKCPPRPSEDTVAHD
jgi:hypothetical protein